MLSSLLELHILLGSSWLTMAIVKDFELLNKENYFKNNKVLNDVYYYI